MGRALNTGCNWRQAMALAIALGAGGCAFFVSPGEPARNFLNPQIARAYLPLRATDYLVLTHMGAAVVIAPGVAVTNAHNANLIDPALVIGKVSGYDLMFFHTQRDAAIAQAAPRMGETVIAYGQGKGGGLRMSPGTIRQFWPAAFGYESDAGPGFSGGPVVDGGTGALLGITYGFVDRGGHRLMLAYTMDFVTREWTEIEAQTAPH